MKNAIENENKIERKNIAASLYRHSTLSVDAIAKEVKMDVKEVQKIIDEQVIDDALEMFVDHSVTIIENVMTDNVVCLDISNTALDAAKSMAENEIGSIVVTIQGKPYGIVTEKDLVRKIGAKDIPFKQVILEDLASWPLIAVQRGTSIDDAAKIMIKHKIHRLPILDSGKLVGIVTVSDLAAFLSPARKSALALAVLHAISRGRESRQ